MKLSIIIPVYNEAKYLRGCLDALSNQSHKDYEVIVVDDGSTDDTQNLLNSYQPTYPLIKLQQSHSGAGKARNYASSHASGEILVFIDADMEASPGYLEEISSPIRNKQTIGTFTTNEYVANYDNHWASCWNWEYIHTKTDRRLTPDHPPESQVFRAILKSAFDSVGGYAEVGYGEDWTLSDKLGETARLAPGANILHYNPASASVVIRQAQWFATRPYKLGEWGRAIGLLRASLPVSIAMALVGVFRYRSLFYFWFKLVYDFGIFSGILKFWLTHQYSQ